LRGIFATLEEKQKGEYAQKELKRIATLTENQAKLLKEIKIKEITEREA